MVRVRVAVADAAAVEDHRVVEQRAIAVGRRLQLSEVVGEQLRVDTCRSGSPFRSSRDRSGGV